MREFFISGMERIISVVMVIGVIGVFFAGLSAMFMSPNGFGFGLIQGLVIWAAGAIYLILMGGMLYLGLGIYDSTRRTAAAVEELVRRN